MTPDAGAAPAARPEPMLDAAQRAAGVIAARHRGDAAGAEALLADFPTEQARTLGFFVVAELSLKLLAQATAEPMDRLVQELSMNIATSQR